MVLCEVCEAIDLDVDEFLLGGYNELVIKAEVGCESCKFFCDILHSSTRWEQAELPDRVVFMNSKHLDVREPNELDCSGWDYDDLLFDYCVSEDYTGKCKSSHSSS